MLSEGWPCHVFFSGRIEFASLEVNLGGGWGLLVYLIISSPEPKAPR